MEKMEFFSISFPPRDDLSFAPSVYDRVRIGVLFSDGNLFSIFIARDLGCMASSYSPLEASSMRSSKLLSTVHARSLGGYIVLYVRLSFAKDRKRDQLRFYSWTVRLSTQSNAREHHEYHLSCELRPPSTFIAWSAISGLASKYGESNTFLKFTASYVLSAVQQP